ncbi:MAG: RNA pyrophosphohydrolase [Pseudomonadota bacterium]
MTRAAETLPYRPCVGVVLARTDGQVFLGERIDAPGAWQMPQGGIDDGETPSEAGLRELEEETGVPRQLVAIEAVTDDWIRYDLPAELVGKALGGKWRGQEQKWLLCRFNGTDPDIRIDTAHPEFARWTWALPKEVIDAIVPFKRDVYRAVFDAFRDNLA